jgi:hypothetical protein
MQVLRGANRLHQLQGREVAFTVRSGAFKDHASADFRRVHPTSEIAKRRYQEGKEHCAPAIRV